MRGCIFLMLLALATAASAQTPVLTRDQRAAIAAQELEIAEARKGVRAALLIVDEASAELARLVESYAVVGYILQPETWIYVERPAVVKTASRVESETREATTVAEILARHPDDGAVKPAGRR